MIKKSNISYHVQSRSEGITDMSTTIFPGHFTGIVCGKPGSGKTTLINFILTSSDFYFKKFHFIYIVSPSKAEFASLQLPNENLTSELDWDWVNDKVRKSQLNCYVNALFVFDDCVSEFKSRDVQLTKFIFNRRHLLTNGMVSVLLTTQKFNCVPTTIRTCTTFIVTFDLTERDWNIFRKEIVREDKQLHVARQLTFTKSYHFLIYRLDTNNYYCNFDDIIF